MSADTWRAHLEALRAECEAMLALLGPRATAAEADPAPPACEHPDHLRVPVSTYGEAPRFWCPQCRTEVAGA